MKHAAVVVSQLVLGMLLLASVAGHVALGWTGEEQGGAHVTVDAIADALWGQSRVQTFRAGTPSHPRSIQVRIGHVAEVCLRGDAREFRYERLTGQLRMVAGSEGPQAALTPTSLDPRAAVAFYVSASAEFKKWLGQAPLTVEERARHRVALCTDLEESGQASLSLREVQSLDQLLSGVGVGNYLGATGWVLEWQALGRAGKYRVRIDSRDGLPVDVNFLSADGLASEELLERSAGIPGQSCPVDSAPTEPRRSLWTVHDEFLGVERASLIDSSVPLLLNAMTGDDEPWPVSLRRTAYALVQAAYGDARMSQLAMAVCEDPPRGRDFTLSAAARALPDGDDDASSVLAYVVAEMAAFLKPILDQELNIESRTPHLGKTDVETTRVIALCATPIAIGLLEQAIRTELARLVADGER